MEAGKLYNVSVTMKNTGNIPWNESSQIRLGATQDASKFGSDRYYIASGVTVPVGGQYTWNFTMTAANTTGNYNLAYRMVWENHVWFGQAAITTVNVVDSTTAQNFTIDLNSGWNLISLPLEPRKNNISDIFPPDVIGHIVDIWGWDNASQDFMYYCPDPNDYFYQYYPALTKLEAGKGYWVYSDQASSFTVQGTIPGGEPNNTIETVAGWNLVGPTGLSSLTPTSMYPDVIDIWGWDNASQDFMYNCPDPNDYFYQYYPNIDYIEPGHAYWVCMP
jgi:hypothetical protein